MSQVEVDISQSRRNLWPVGETARKEKERGRKIDILSMVHIMLIILNRSVTTAEMSFQML